MKTLVASVGAGRIKAWTSATKGTQITLPTTYTIGTDTVPTEIYVEGIDIGEAVLDMVLKQSSGTEIARDKVKFTVKNAIPLVFSDISANSPHALSGDTVTISFTASEALNGDPTVTVNSHAVSNLTHTGLDYSCTYQIGSSSYDHIGEAAIRIVGASMDADTADVTDWQALFILQAAQTGDVNGFTYDKMGNRKTSWDSRGYTFYTYDLVGRLTKVTDPDGRWVAYEYDNASNRTKMTTHSGSPAFEHVTQYEYNNRGSLSKVIDQLDGETTYTYKDNGLVDTITYPNSTKAIHSYNSRNWLTTLSNQKSDNTIIAEFTYSYDAASWGKNGTRTSVIENILKPDGNRINAQVDYEYDDLYRLVHEHRIPYNSGDAGVSYEYNFVYDAAGNRTQWEIVGGTTTNYTYDAANKMTSPGTFTYDDKGNTLTQTVGNVTTTYTWDYLNRMGQWAKTGETTQAYVYNADSMRVSVIPSGGTAAEYLLDFMEPAEKITGASIISNVGPHLISSISDNNTRTSYSADGIDSVRVTTDDGGNVMQAAVYDGYGAMVVSWPSSVTADYGYAGKYGYYMDVTGQEYVKMRYYNAMVGRWLSRDPIGYKGGPNLYVYVNNNPINAVDPTGEVWVCLAYPVVCKAVIGCLAGFAIGAGASIVTDIINIINGGSNSVDFCAAAASGVCGCFAGAIWGPGGTTILTQLGLVGLQQLCTNDIRNDICPCPR